MSKPLASQNTFAALSPPWSLVSLDANFTNVWAAIDDIGTYSNVFADTGAVNAMVVVVTAPLTFALVDGVTLDVKVGNTTTSNAPTLNVAGTGAKTIVNADNSILAIGQLPANMRVRFVYDLANTVWRITSITAGVSAFVVGPPTSGIALTVNGITGGGSNPTGDIISAVASGNSSCSLTIQNQTNGTAATTIVSVQDNAGNFGFMEIQSALCNAQETGGVSGSALNIGSSTSFPVQLCTNDTVRITLGATGNITTAAPTSGTAFLLNANANARAFDITDGTATFDISTDVSHNFYVGTSTAHGLNLQTGGAGTTRVALSPTGAFIQGFGPVAAALVDMTPDKSSWTTTLSGPWVAGNNVTGTLKWERQGTQVTIWCDTTIDQVATIATTMTANALPAAITPSSNREVVCAIVENNTASAQGFVFVNSAGTINFTVATVSGSFLVGGNFTGAGRAGILANWSITYSL